MTHLTTTRTQQMATYNVKHYNFTRDFVNGMSDDETPIYDQAIEMAVEYSNTEYEKKEWRCLSYPAIKNATDEGEENTPLTTITWENGVQLMVKEGSSDNNFALTICKDGKETSLIGKKPQFECATIEEIQSYIIDLNDMYNDS